MRWFWNRKISKGVLLNQFSIQWGFVNKCGVQQEIFYGGFMECDDVLLLYVTPQVFFLAYCKKNILFILYFNRLTQLFTVMSMYNIISRGTSN